MFEYPGRPQPPCPPLPDAHASVLTGTENKQGCGLARKGHGSGVKDVVPYDIAKTKMQ